MSRVARKTKKLADRQVRARLEIIAEAIGLPSWEIDRAMANLANMVDFAMHYGQSLDYIQNGDVRPMLREMQQERLERERQLQLRLRMRRAA